MPLIPDAYFEVTHTYTSALELNIGDQMATNTYFGALDTDSALYYQITIPDNTYARRETIDIVVSDVSGIRSMLNESLNRDTIKFGAPEAEQANRAIADALSLLRQAPTRYRPTADVTSEALALLQWRSQRGGVILLFSGDGEVILSTRSHTSNYTDSTTEMAINSANAAAISAQVSRLYS
jgi:hypothetical protein